MPTERKDKREQKETIREEILEELLNGYEKPEDLLGENGIFDELKRRLLERVLDGELTAHLGYEKHEVRPLEQYNARNGHSSKRVKTRASSLKSRCLEIAKAVSSQP